MSQKNETIPLLVSLIITVGVIGGICWWIFGRVTTEKNPETTSSSTQPQTLAEAQNVPSGLFSYGGSTTWAPIRRDVDAIVQTVFPNFQLRYTDPPAGPPGSTKGIEMLLNNQLSFAQSSRPLETQEYQQASQRGFTLKEIPIAIDGIAIAVHPDLNIPGITVEQLKGIYTGKITNWSQIGGSDLPIIPLSRHIEDGGTVEFFVKNVLGGESFGQNVEMMNTTTLALRRVSKTPGSIYYASAPEVVPQCEIKSLPLGQQAGQWVAPYQEPFVPASQCPERRNQLNSVAFQNGSYPITRRLFVIVKQNGQIDEQAGFAYANLLLTRQGQDLISKAGFVKIR